MNLDLSQITAQNFEEKSLEVFRYQYQNNDIYRAFCDSFKVKDPKSISEIPFLPTSFFKSHKVSCFAQEDMSYFESSGTSGQINAKHYIKDITQYHQSIELGYKHFFSDRKYTIIGLLPHYLERQNSSLVEMVRHWMKLNHQEEYFFLHNLEDLNSCVADLLHKKNNILLIGISFALLDYSQKYRNESPALTIVETGGMKGSRAEMPKLELVKTLSSSFPQSRIISEYGMCELFSQAYSDENLNFNCPPWMKVYVSELNDPITVLEEGKGVAKVIDLANIDSCSFIETQDLIDLRSDGTFQIIGRLDHSDIRGCSLMYT